MKKFLQILTLAGSVLFIRTHSASAALFDIWRGTGKGGETCNVYPGGCSLCDGLKVAINIVNDLTAAAIIVTVGMVVFGSIRLMLSAGSEQAVRDARGTITSAVIGLVIVLCGWLIVNTLIHIISGNVNFPWAGIQC
jgi:hypothetical protein